MNIRRNIRTTEMPCHGKPHRGRKMCSRQNL